MTGLAKERFVEKVGYTPWKPSHKQERWPALKACAEYIDYALAEHLLKERTDATEEMATFICHLSLAARQGHLCIKVNAQELVPSVDAIWEEEYPQNLRDIIIKGSQTFPQSCPIHREKDLFYFQRYWDDETLFREHFWRLIEEIPSVNFDLRRVQEQLKETALLQEQTEAVLAACQSCLTILCGGPGTGKTHTAGHLIRIYWETLSTEQREQSKMVLAAPTGKAAANLQRSLMRAVANLAEFKPIKAQTLHSLLDKDQEESLSADLVLVDESSMIDVQMMARLLKAIKPGARLVLLGDRYQLPPVEAGSLFSDAIAMLLSEQKTAKHVIELKKCLRAELKEIVSFAERVNCGDEDAALDFLDKNHQGLSRFSYENLPHIVSLFPCFKKSEQSSQELLGLFQKFRVLSPLRKGPFGVDALNRWIYERLRKQVPEDKQFVVPIMIVSNDYRLKLFNGEVGLLIGAEAIFSDDQGCVRSVAAVSLPKYEYAYCLSVHKSQGSEFNRVLLMLPEGSETFGREVLYTAVTRARQKLEICSSEETLRKTIRRKCHRLSGVLEE